MNERSAFHFFEELLALAGLASGLESFGIDNFPMRRSFFSGLASSLIMSSDTIVEITSGADIKLIDGVGVEDVSKKRHKKRF